MKKALYEAVLQEVHDENRLRAEKARRLLAQRVAE
jgi:hypothetical protein